ncbi:hypothetical protein HY489_00730 [Candidatus Woesearchaeota archaeon]|nr:hypothetical protein [Candidatus Woesearchaeota archaeon]
MLLLLLISAPLLSDYPGMFFRETFNATIIIGDMRDPEELAAANYFLTVLPKHHFELPLDPYDQQIDIANIPVQKASEVETLAGHAIIIGTPCTNNWIQRLLHTVPCNSTLAQNEALVKLTKVDNNNVLVIAGSNGKMTLEATKYFHEQGQWLADELRIKHTRYTYLDQSSSTQPTTWQLKKTKHAISHDYRTIGKTKYGATIIPR